jgi:hypothetical protein
MAEEARSDLMEVQPVRRNRTAKYPTKQRLSEKPDLLKAMPQRWRTNRAVATLVGSVSLLAVAKSVQKQDDPEYITTGMPGMTPANMASYDILHSFEKEAKKAGLHLVMMGRHVPVRVVYGSTTKTKQYVIDLIDPKTGVGLEFVDDFDVDNMYRGHRGKTRAEVAKAVRDGCKHIKNGSRIKVIAGTDESKEKQLRKAKRELKSFFQWLKKQGVI